MSKIKTRLVNFCLKHILNAPLVEDVLRVENGQFKLGNELLPPIDRNSIISGANGLKNMLVWQCLIREMKQLGQQTIGAKSRGWEDVNFGKALLYIADLLEQKVEKLSKYPLIQENGQSNP